MIYPFRVFLQEENQNQYWVAKSTCLKGCIGQGNTANEAIKELEDNELEWIEAAKIAGIDVPKIPVMNSSQYSGKLTLRIAPMEHYLAAENARNENISLNQYIVDAIVAKNASYI